MIEWWEFCMESLPSDIFHNFFQYSLKKRGYIEINYEEEAGGIIHLKQFFNQPLSNRIAD